MVDANGVESINNMFQENSMLHTEINNLRMREKALQQTVDAIMAKIIALLAEHSTAMIALLRQSRRRQRLKNAQLRAGFDNSDKVVVCLAREFIDDSELSGEPLPKYIFVLFDDTQPTAIPRRL